MTVLTSGAPRAVVQPAHPDRARALACALLAATVLPVSFVLANPPAAHAQAAVQPERTVFGVRFQGEWVDDFGLRYVFTDEGLGRLKGVVTRASTGEIMATIDWRPHKDGMGGNFSVPSQNPSDPVTDRGITGYVDHEGQAELFVRAGMFPNERSAPNHLDTVVRGGRVQRLWRGDSFTLRRPANHPQGGDAGRWSGSWKTTRGLLELKPEGHNLFGSLKRGERAVRTERLAILGASGGVAPGAWEREGEWTPNVDRGDLTLRLSPDGRSFSGWYTEVTRTGNTRIPWTGERVDAEPARPPVQQSPQPSADQLALMRGLEGRWRENDGPSLWRFPAAGQNGVTALTWHSVDTEGAATSVSFVPGQNGSTLEGRSPDGERVIVERNQLGEVHVIWPAQNGKPFRSKELSRLPNAPTGPVTAPGPAPSQTPPAPSQPAPSPHAPSAPASSGFKPLNRVDVRVDRVVVARGYPTHQVHAFITVKNTSATPQHFTGWLKVVLADADGVSEERSQPYRASGEPAALFASTPVIQPGGELRARYIFIPEVDARLKTITLSEGGQRAEFPVSGF